MIGGEILQFILNQFDSIKNWCHSMLISLGETINGFHEDAETAHFYIDKRSRENI